MASRRPTLCLATDTNYEVATRNVEDIYIDTGVGADTGVVSGDLGGTRSCHLDHHYRGRTAPCRHRPMRAD